MQLAGLLFSRPGARDILGFASGVAFCLSGKGDFYAPEQTQRRRGSRRMRETLRVPRCLLLVAAQRER